MGVQLKALKYVLQNNLKKSKQDFGQLDNSNSNILEVPMLPEVSCHKKEWPTLGQIVSFFIIRGHSQTTFTIFGFF